MPFTHTYFTGFEMGRPPVPSADVSQINPGGTGQAVEISTATKNTGNFGLSIRPTGGSGSTPHWIRFPCPGNQMYGGVWIKPDWNVSSSGIIKIGAILSDASEPAYFRYEDNHFWHLYVDGVKVASSAVNPQDAFHFLEFYFNIANSGQIILKQDGNVVINFSGDTQPGATTQIDYLRFYGQFIGGNMVIDDLTIGTGDFPSNFQYGGYNVIADVLQEWTPSSGTSHFALVNAFDDAKFISSSVNAQRDTFQVQDYGESGQSPVVVSVWVRARNDGGGENVRVYSGDGVNEATSSPISTSSSFLYYQHVLVNAPDGGPWTPDKLNDLIVGVETSV